ncbi:sulfhydryl oxidase 2 isoform X1 [Neofelis nebulosa]|uniref:sulfhydryl oxidase 2 isoform X1 n=1 Tax=Neofelis nebulosa TaxID=61452 RepID=UPI00272B6C9E|nr:sulfhydryl oxidase 2 isoform X1 [Neofelis nebulosa]
MGTSSVKGAEARTRRDATDWGPVGACAVRLLGAGGGEVHRGDGTGGKRLSGLWLVEKGPAPGTLGAVGGRGPAPAGCHPRSSDGGGLPEPGWLPGCFCMPLLPQHSRPRPALTPSPASPPRCPPPPPPPRQAGKIPRLPGMVRRQRRAGRVGLPVVRGSPCVELVGKAELGGHVSRVSWRGRGLGDWAAAIRVAALDCAEEENHEVCRAYDVHFYPTFRYFKAFTKEFITGENFKGPDRELQTVRRTMIDFLQNHTDGHRPPACPPLGPVRPSDILSLLDSRDGRYVAILFESNSSYVGREVILDLLPYENIVVKRALDTDKAFLEKLGVSSVPSCYLIYPNGSHGLINIGKPLRSFFSSYLKSLPDVRKKLLSVPERPNKAETPEIVVWREFDRAKLYTADLESGLHYLLRVELASHKSLAGAELRTLKDFVTVLAKLFPGRAPVRKLLETLQEWLASLPLDRIPYNAVLDLANNKMRISGIFLINHIKWVGCQGSRPEFRGYTCALWKLFHTLTVQAGAHPEALDGTGLEGDPQAVLQSIRRYIRTFFGCKECAEHFEELARESMGSVKTADQAILWLWKKHNFVNNRLAGHLSEDPKFPKVPWPSPDLCPACHEEVKGLHSWNEGQVLLFLKQHYGSGNLVDTYAEDQGDASDGGGPPGGGERERGHASPEKPRGDPRAESARPPSVLPPRPRLSEGSQLGLDGRLQSVSWAEGRREAEAVVPFLGMGFSSLDMSLCVVLYVASSLFLMMMYFFFRVRSKRWKVRHHRPSV